MSTSGGAMGSRPGSPGDLSVRRTPRPGGSLGAGVVLGVALGLLAPVALMSQHIGGLFGGFVDLYPVVLAELVISIMVWLVVGVVLVARGAQRRMGIGVLIGGGFPALLLLGVFLPVL